MGWRQCSCRCSVSKFTTALCKVRWWGVRKGLSPQKFLPAYQPPTTNQLTNQLPTNSQGPVPSEIPKAAQFSFRRFLFLFQKSVRTHYQTAFIPETCNANSFCLQLKTAVTKRVALLLVVRWTIMGRLIQTSLNLGKLDVVVF